MIGLSAIEAAIRSGNVELVDFLLSTLDCENIEEWLNPEWLFLSLNQLPKIRKELIEVWIKNGLDPNYSFPEGKAQVFYKC